VLVEGGAMVDPSGRGRGSSLRTKLVSADTDENGPFWKGEEDIYGDVCFASEPLPELLQLEVQAYFSFFKKEELND
jgi:hypothetical protein